MSFTLKIKNIPDKDIGLLIARMDLPRKMDYEIRHTSKRKDPSDGPTRKHRPRTTKVTMTGKSPQANSQLAVGLAAFEKLEATKGIGTISVEDLMKNLKTKKKELLWCDWIRI